MKRITQLLAVLAALSVASETCSAVLILEGITKERAERELGIVMKRELIGTIGSVTNEAGISVEFAPKGRLQGFLFVALDVYSELPTNNEHGSAEYRRLTSVTLLPLTQTQGKVRVFFAVDQEYLDKTDVIIRVHSSGGTDPNGYTIRLSRKDFPPPRFAANSRPSLDAAMNISLHSDAQWRRAPYLQSRV